MHRVVQFLYYVVNHWDLAFYILPCQLEQRNLIGSFNRVDIMLGHVGVISVTLHWCFLWGFTPISYMILEEPSFFEYGIVCDKYFSSNCFLADTKWWCVSDPNCEDTRGDIVKESTLDVNSLTVDCSDSRFVHLWSCLGYERWYSAKNLGMSMFWMIYLKAGCPNSFCFTKFCPCLLWKLKKCFTLHFS